MRRFATLLVLLLSSIPFGVSISGCSHNVAPAFCNGGDSGPTTTQTSTDHVAADHLWDLAQLRADRTVAAAHRHRLQGLERLGVGIHLRHHRHDHRGHSAIDGPFVRGVVEPQHGRGHSRLHLLHSDQ